MKIAVSASILAGFIGILAASAAAAEKLPQSQCVLLPVPADPTVSFRFWFKVGSQDDPPGKEGLAAVTSAMLTEAATEKHSYEAILDRLFPLAGSYSASTAVEMTVISGRIHKDNLGEYYPLLMQAVLMPAFRQEDLDRIKGRAIDYLENGLRYSSDEELAKAVLSTRRSSPARPTGTSPPGGCKACAGITLDDVRRFYHEHYTATTVLGLGGGYDPALLQQVRADLASLPPGGPRAAPPPRPQPIRGLHVTIVEKDAPATAISMGAPIHILRGQPDWYSLAVANSWLGEHRHSGSHLYQVIRELRGLNYGDYSYLEHFRQRRRAAIPPAGRRPPAADLRAMAPLRAARGGRISPSGRPCGN